MRRSFLQTSASALGVAVLPNWSLAQGAAPSLVTSDAARPVAAQGLQFGDPSGAATIVWSRSDRPSRMIVEWSLDAQFRDLQRIVGPYALGSAAGMLGAAALPSRSRMSPTRARARR